MNQLGRAQNRIDFIGLQVADHIEAHLGQLRMFRQTCELADELLRTVLGKMAIPRLNSGNGFIDANGLGHGYEARGVVGTACAIKRRIKPLQNLLAASAHQVQIIIHCQSPPQTAKQVVPC